MLKTKPGYKLKLSTKRANYRAEDIMDDLIEKKIKHHYTNMSMLKYLKEHYGFTQTWAYNWMNAIGDKLREIQEKTIINLLEEQQMKLLNEIEELKKTNTDKRLILDYIREYNRISGLYEERIRFQGDIVIKAEFDMPKTPSQDDKTDQEDNT